MQQGRKANELILSLSEERQMEKTFVILSIQGRTNKILNFLFAFIISVFEKQKVRRLSFNIIFDFSGRFCLQCI